MTHVKDYIKGKFPVIFNIYLASLDDLDEDEKEFIDLLEELPEKEQIFFAKKVNDFGFSKDIIDEVKSTKIEPGLDIEPEIESVKINTGKWAYKKKIDPINDDVIIYLSLKSDSYSARYSDYASLILRWTEGRTELYINWDNYLSSEGIKVVYRLGDQKASSSTWAISTNGRSTFYGSYGSSYSSKKTINFINKLLEVDTLAAQVESYGESPVTAVFDVRGLKDAVLQYNDILKWIE
ncbi:MAG: type VI secretion system-associated protein TagO [Bacteroidales bacterium]|nr:type VI secretion system-associated protein TagO [Actinomycetota bacterium]MDX9797345.1 type VI secretion system-associated protein TagO [Bacteroidales bacterium]